MVTSEVQERWCTFQTKQKGKRKKQTRIGWEGITYNPSAVEVIKNGK